MNVIFDSAHNDWLAIEVMQNSTKVIVQFVTQDMITQERATVLRGKHGVNEYLGQRLWHAGLFVRKGTCGYNPYRVDGSGTS